MKRLGQHFLINRRMLRDVVVALAPEQGDAIIEIGAGHGELTDELKNESEKTTIVAIEKDAHLAALLEKKFGNSATITVVVGDALLELAPITQRIAPQPYVLTGNIPYYLTGRLLRLAGELAHMPRRAVFTIQKEVALRIAATPPRMNKLAASVQFWADPKVVRVVPRQDFRPMPQVDGAIIVLEPRPGALEDPMLRAPYYAAVRALFAQPRKTILNNLRNSSGFSAGGSDAFAARLRGIGIDPQDRPQDLSTHAIAKLARMFAPSE